MAATAVATTCGNAAVGVTRCKWRAGRAGWRAGRSCGLLTGLVHECARDAMSSAATQAAPARTSFFARFLLLQGLCKGECWLWECTDDVWQCEVVLRSISWNRTTLRVSFAISRKIVVAAKRLQTNAEVSSTSLETTVMQAARERSKKSPATARTGKQLPTDDPEATDTSKQNPHDEPYLPDPRTTHPSSTESPARLPTSSSTFISSSSSSNLTPSSSSSST